MTNTDQPITNPVYLPDVFIVLEENRLAPRSYVRDVLPDSWLSLLWDGSKWKLDDNVGDSTALAAFNDSTWLYVELRP